MDWTVKPTLLEVQSMRYACRLAGLYHDSPATRGAFCKGWLTCHCETAERIREADTGIRKLEKALES